MFRKVKIVSKQPQTAGKKAAEKPTQSGNFNVSRVRWFNPQPNGSDEKWLSDNEDKLVELGLSILEAVPEGGRYTAKFDVKSGRWLAILFVPSGLPEFDMDALSVRGSTAFDALILLGYFHYIKFDQQWIGEDRGGDGRWG